MIEKDTICLLRECDAGIQMGTKAIDDVLSDVTDTKFKGILSKCRSEHEKLNTEIRSLLSRFHDNGKDPDPIAQGMSELKTSIKLKINDSDSNIAELMTDGCNMGVKSLNKYLNKYEAADEVSKDIAKKLINIEEKLAVDIRCFL